MCTTACYIVDRFINNHPILFAASVVVALVVFSFIAAATIVQVAAWTCGVAC